MSSLGTWRMILAATGVHASLIPLGCGLVITVLWRNGVIESFGPFILAAPLPVLLAVPSLLGVACGISHIPVRTPVITRNGRTIIARLLSHLTVLGGGAAVVALGAMVGSEGTTGAALRNLFVFSALALAAAGVAGPIYSWLPVVVLFGMAILSNADESAWSIHGLVMAPEVRFGQFAIIVAVFLCALAIAALDPRGLGYLPRRHNVDRLA